MNIRYAVMNDVDAIARIHTKCWDECYPFIPPEIHEQRSLEFRTTQWSNAVDSRNPGEALFAVLDESGGEVVGFCYCRPNIDPDIPFAQAELHAAYVLREYRGGDVGPIMMKTMLEFLTEQSCTPACLWAWHKNPIRRWYSALGWQLYIRRNRDLMGSAIPECGYVCPDTQAMINRLDRIIHGESGRAETQPHFQLVRSD